MLAKCDKENAYRMLSDHPILSMLCNVDIEKVLWAIYLWLHADVNGYKIRSFILARVSEN